MNESIQDFLDTTSAKLEPDIRFDFSRLTFADIMIVYDISKNGITNDNVWDFGRLNALMDVIQRTILDVNIDDLQTLEEASSIVELFAKEFVAWYKVNND